jgi:hypothetical protein
VSETKAIRELVERLREAEERIAAERGPFVLFALLHRVGSLWNSWDVAVSAPWADEMPRMDAYALIDCELRKHVPASDFRYFRTLVVVPTDWDELEELFEEHPVEHGRVIVRNRELGDEVIRKGYIITCQRPVRQAA